MNLPINCYIKDLLVPVFVNYCTYSEWIINSSLLNFMSFQLEAVNNLLYYGNYIAAFLFFIAASTDGLDGYIARKENR